MERDAAEFLGLEELLLGSYVRVRLSGECAYGEGKYERHVAETDGAVGMLYDRLPEGDHPYMVMLHVPYWADGAWHRVGQFARTELEPTTTACPKWRLPRWVGEIDRE